MPATLTFGHLVAFLTAIAMCLAILPPSQAAASDVPLEVVGVEMASRSDRGLLEVDVPAATRPGDLLVAVFGVHGRKDVPGPEGWELVDVHHHARQMTQTVWSRVAGDDEPSSYWWSGNDRHATAVSITAIRGADVSAPLGDVASGSASRTKPVVVPSVTPEVDGALVVGLWSANGGGDIVVPEEMESVDSIVEDFAMAVSVERAAGAGIATGKRVATRTVFGGVVGHLLVVTPGSDQQSIPADEATEPAPTEPAPTEPDPTEPDPTELAPTEPGPTEPGPTEPDPTEPAPTEPGPTEPDPDHDHSPETDTDAGTLSSSGPAVLWSDATSWPSGQLPTVNDDVVVDGHVIVDADASAATITVAAGGTLEFDPAADVLLSVRGNVVVRGLLRMQPKDSTVDHILRFVDVDESAFVGGGHEVLSSDVGLWFEQQGRAEIEGPDRLAWTRAATTIAAGARQIELEQVPDGWRVGDEISVTPTSAPGTYGHSDGYSGGRLTAISGKTVTLDTPVEFSHPRVDGQWGAEVMNMTRNARIEGTPEGRAHVLFMHTGSKQTLRNLELRHLGPRADTSESYRKGGERHTITAGYLGRYPLHFHHNFDGSRGSLVENVLVRDSGHRAFVAHASHGITFRGTVAHDVFDTPYWWDRRDTTDGLGSKAVWDPPTIDISYERAIASLVKTDPPFRGHRLGGFQLGHGLNMSITESVAVGVQGGKTAAGFVWPEGTVAESGDSNAVDFWNFAGNVGHNNRANGIFTWQNTNDPRHVVADSVMYHNGDYGVFHGAYTNRYTYRDLILYGNKLSGFDLHAQGAMPLTNLTIDGADISQYGFTTGRHRLDRSGAVLANAKISRYREHGIAFLSPDREVIDVIEPSFDGPESTWFYVADQVPASSSIRVQLKDGTAFRLHPASSDRGVPVSAWNARKEMIPAFG